MTARLATLFLFLSLAHAAAATPLHHRVSVRIEPAEHRIELNDTVQLGPGEGSASFTTHARLKVRLTSRGKLTREEFIDAQDGGVPRRRYVVTPPAGVREVSLRISGRIHHSLKTEGEEYARSFAGTPGVIDEEGVFLSGTSAWLPEFEDRMFTFDLSVNLPEGYDAVSQGTRTSASTDGGRRNVVWSCPHPMEEAYLIAARFHEYSQEAGKLTVQAFLRSPDEGLARTYMETTAQYVDMYRRILGPYPYSKFALVENFWETGYGMPSFTLLGPKVIRLPFILHSSYPHEILHNWWGNGVYVDWESGNWCEGLTAYLADHLIKEGRGQGESYRRSTLEKYGNYVGESKDFPLTDFRSRHSGATEAVGYGKSLMLWHMLRQHVGDDVFLEALAAFYREYRFKRASFTDLELTFTRVAGEDLAPFFAQWVTRTGAPTLAAELVEGRRKELALKLRQTQAAAPYELDVRVALTRTGRPEAEVLTLLLSEREQSFALPNPETIQRVDVDPHFDLFRHLDRAEIPPSLGSLFGADDPLMVLPSEDTESWRHVARSWLGPEADAGSIVMASQLDTLPAHRAVWILGSSNPWSRLFESVRSRGDAPTEPREGDSFVYVARHPGNPDAAIGWVGGTNAQAHPGLARKLPHYGKYSYLQFEGDEPSNTVKGQWGTTGSPLSRVREGHSSERAALPTRRALAELAPVYSPADFARHVDHLASTELAGRATGSEGAALAADYIAEAFERAGLRPAGDDGSWFQAFSAEHEGRSVPMRNVVGVLPGSKAEWAKQSVVVGAHFDHLGHGWPDVRTGNEGLVHPGADDNASGVAVLIELARRLGAQHPERSIVFAAFDGEEWGLHGSRHYVKTMERWPVSDTFAMVNMDTVGRLGEAPLTVIGTGTASEWKHVAMGIGFTTGISSKAIPDDPGGSDQKSFQDAGVPAIQLFTGAHEDYHRPGDTADKVDHEGLVKVATFTEEAVAYLSGRPDPLTSSLKPRGSNGPQTQPQTRRKRRVSLGTMPDMEFSGPGVRVLSVFPGSAAALAGLEGGDVLVGLGDEDLTDLRAMSVALAKRSPGDTVRLKVRRGEEDLILSATLKAR